MSSTPTPADIAADASWLAQAMDPASGNVRLVRMAAEDYRRESFLDDRIFEVQRAHHIVPWTTATGGFGEDARADAQWIFHIGHVGSTLLSRLLGELPGVLAVREPRILRDLTVGSSPAPYIDGVRRLLSRTFAPADRAIVKATSFVSELAADLIGESGRAIFVHASPAAYLGTSLAGENTMKEVAALAPTRTARMDGRVNLKAAPDRPASQVAAAWACEMTALEQAASRLAKEQVKWLDFDALLAAVPDKLIDAAQFLGVDAPRHLVEAIAAGPLMKRYSKAPEYDYSPRLRSDLIAQASAAHRSDIAQALAMLEQAAQESPLLASALNRSGGGVPNV